MVRLKRHWIITLVVVLTILFLSVLKSIPGQGHVVQGTIKRIALPEHVPEADYLESIAQLAGQDTIKRIALPEHVPEADYLESIAQLAGQDTIKRIALPEHVPEADYLESIAQLDGQDTIKRIALPEHVPEADYLESIAQLAGQGTIKRIALPEHGPEAYYLELKDVCVNTSSNTFELPGQSEDGWFQNSDFAFYTYEGNPSHFMGWHQLLLKSAVPYGKSFCRETGTTLFFEESAGLPGHIAHFAENIVKYFEFVDKATKRVDQIWFHNRNNPVAGTSWEREMLRLSLGNVSFTPYKDPYTDSDVPLPRLLSSVTSNVMCPTMCFEHGLFASVATVYFMSESNAAHVRDRAWQHCGLDMLESKARKQPSYYLHFPRPKNRRIRNLNEVETMINQEGFQAVEQPSVDSFCSQVKSFGTADVVVNMHGAANTNVMFMRPGSVFIEVFNEGFYWPCFKVISDNSNVYYLDFTNTLPLPTDSTNDPKQADAILDTESLRRFIRYARQVWNTNWSKRPTLLQECMKRTSNETRLGRWNELNRQHCYVPDEF